MHLPLLFFPFLLLPLVSANYYLYLVNCTGNPQNQPWIGHAYYSLPSPPVNFEHPYDISIAVIGAAAAAAWRWEGNGGGAIMGSWRLEYHIDGNASSSVRGDVAGGGTRRGDAGRMGDDFSCFKDDGRNLYQTGFNVTGTGEAEYCRSDYWCEL